MLKRKKISSSKTWNTLIKQFNNTHILQTWEWGQLKKRYDWTPLYYSWYDNTGECVAASLILKKTVRFLRILPSMNLLYAPRGPLIDWANSRIALSVLDELEYILKEEQGFLLKIDPEIITNFGILGSDDALVEEKGTALREELKKRNWVFSSDQIQFQNTVWLDLSKSEDQLLKDMKQKTRYNIRMAERKGVKIKEINSDDFSSLYNMYAETSLRDGFIIRPYEYYELVWKKFMQSNMASGLIAKVEGEVVAGLFVYYFAKKAWYLYGMSTEKHRDKMPNHLLQWQAIRIAKSLGCETYDMWGAPDNFDENDPMWGVFRFKQGFSGTVVQTIGAWDLIRSPLVYTLFEKTKQIFQTFSRLVRRKQIQNEMQM